jgi:hypothetical protein
MSQLIDIDSKLLDAIEDIKDKIINFLFSGNDELIDLWLDDKDVVFDPLKFKNLIQGDWSRKNSYYNNEYVGLDLDQVFLDKKNNPKQTISQTRLFNELFNEICRPISKDYIHNFNPNLYFLLFDKFNNTKFIKKINGKKETFYLKPNGIKDENNKIIGISFNDEHDKYFRDEILRIIELHSMFIFNPSIRNTKIIRNDKFSKIFIENAVIQYHCNIENIYLNKNAYIDFAYVIDKNIENKLAFKTKAFIEILEKHHNKFADQLRSIDILMMEKASCLDINIKDMKTIIDYFQEFLPKFLQLLYKSGHEYEAIVIFMIEIHKLQEREAIFSVQMKRGMLDNKLISIPKLPIFNPGSITLDMILKNLANEFDFNDDFIDWKIIWKEKKEIVKSKLKDIPKEKYMQNFIKLIHLKDFLTLTNEGIRKVISKLSSDIWTDQKEYWKYQNKLESKYIDTIQSFMSDDSNNIITEYFCQYEYLDRLKVFGIDKYHRTKKIVNSDKKKLNEFGIKKLHDNLPFLKYEEGKFVKWNNYVERIFSHLSEEERLELKNKNNIDIHEIHKQDIIVNYTVMSPSMIQKLNTIWQN